MSKPDIPKFMYFQYGNAFTGSFRALNYKLTPEEETIRVQIWHSQLCSTLAEMEEEREFSKDETGLQAAVDWLETLMENE